MSIRLAASFCLAVWGMMLGVGVSADPSRGVDATGKVAHATGTRVSESERTRDIYQPTTGVTVDTVPLPEALRTPTASGVSSDGRPASNRSVPVTGETMGLPSSVSPNGLGYMDSTYTPNNANFANPVLNFSSHTLSVRKVCDRWGTARDGRGRTYQYCMHYKNVITARLDWRGIHTPKCTVSAVSGDLPFLRSLPGYQGSKVVTADEGTRYTFSCYGDDGRLRSRNVTLTVNGSGPSVPTPSLSLTASPKVLPSGGGTTTLRWRGQNVYNCRLTSSDGLNAVVGRSGSRAQNVRTPGSHRFTISCRYIDNNNQPRTISRGVVVRVNTPPPPPPPAHNPPPPPPPPAHNPPPPPPPTQQPSLIVSIRAPNTVTVGKPFRISWSTSPTADSCQWSLDGRNMGAILPNGDVNNFTLRNAGRHTFRLHCTKSGYRPGNATKVVNVHNVQPSQPSLIVSIRAPNTVAVGKPFRISWSTSPTADSCQWSLDGRNMGAILPNGSVNNFTLRNAGRHTFRLHCTKSGYRPGNATKVVNVQSLPPFVVSTSIVSSGGNFRIAQLKISNPGGLREISCKYSTFQKGSTLLETNYLDVSFGQFSKTGRFRVYKEKHNDKTCYSVSCTVRVRGGQNSTSYNGQKMCNRSHGGVGEFTATYRWGG